MRTLVPDGGSVATELPDGVVADLLGDEDRCRALRILARRETPVVIDDLAVEAIADESVDGRENVSVTDRRRLRDEFCQRHLPKLTATDVVRYDSMLGTVELVRPDVVTDAVENA